MKLLFDEIRHNKLLWLLIFVPIVFIAERCGEVGRDPATLAVSVHIWGEAGAVAPGPERRQRLRDYADLGLRRAIVQGFAAAKDPRAIDDVIDDAMAVGLLGEAVSPA